MSDLFYGRYQVIDQLGSGGMGIVFHGHDPLLERSVAIKTLHPARLTQPAIDRFLREARTAAKLDSPHVVRIHTIEQQDENYLGKPITVHYIVMEFVAGRTLSEFLNGAPPDEAELHKRLKLFMQVLEGIRYAHSRGVVHRDLKPDNVMVTPEGVVKVMDFGLAFFEDSHSLTDAGQTMGTPAYLSPEQATGSPADHRTDIYSLGVILFELLTGELPIMASHPAEMIRKVIDSPPKSPREFVPDVAPALEMMVSRCLRKAPEQRYDSVEEMIAELELFLKGGAPPQASPPAAPAPKAPEPTQVPWSPPKGASFADGAPPLSRPLDFRSLEPSGPAPVEAENPLNYMPPLIKFGQAPAVASDSWLMEAKENKGPLYEKAERPKPVEIPPIAPGAAVCPRCGAENLRNQASCDTCGMELQQSSYFRIDQEAKAHLAAGLKAMAQGRWQQAVYDLQQALSRNDALGEAHLHLGKAMVELADFEAAQTSLHRALDLLPPDDPQTHLALADLYQRQGRFEEVLACLQEVLRRTPQDTDSRCRLAFLLQEQGRVAEAVDQYRKVLRADTRNLQANRQYGLLLAGGERPEEAIPYLEMACEGDPEDAHTASLLARLYQRGRRLDKAQQVLRQAITHNQENSGLYADLGALYQSQGHEDQALQILGRALDLDKGNRDARVRLASVYERRGNVGQALSELERALEFHPEDLQIHRRLGELYLHSQDLDRALAHFEEVVRLDPASAAMHHRLGKLYLKKNYTDRSIEEYQRAVDLHKVDPEYREDLAMAYYCAKKYDMAAEELRKAHMLDGQNPDYPKAMGMLKFELGDMESAVACLKLALSKRPGDSQAHGMLGQALARQGLSNMAISSYQKALDLDPNLHLMHLYLARAYAQAGRHHDAVASFRKLGSKLGVLEDTRLMSEAYVEMGMSYLASHQPARAAEVFQAALQRDPRDARAAHGLGRVALVRNDLPRAREHVLRALKGEPRNADFLATLADIAGAENRFGEAVEIFRQAINYAPRRPELYERLGRWQRKADQPEEAVETFRRAAGIFPERASFFYWMEGRVHSRLGSHGQAAHIFRRALEHDPGDWNIYRDLAMSCEALGNIPDAVKTLRQAIDRAPESALPKLKDYLTRLERQLAAY